MEILVFFILLMIIVFLISIVIMLIIILILSKSRKNQSSVQNPTQHPHHPNSALPQQNSSNIPNTPRLTLQYRRSFRKRNRTGLLGLLINLGLRKHYQSKRTKVRRPPEVIGWQGEQQVAKVLSQSLPSYIYTQFHNLTFETKSGTTQIDHIVISRYGVFVLETKNIQGSIYGDENSSKWTIKIGNQTHQFQNPIHQNLAHIRHLAPIIGIHERQITSIVVFAGTGSLKLGLPEGVTFIDNCAEMIRNYNQVIFSQIQISQIIRAIESQQLPQTIETHRLHLDNIEAAKLARTGIGPSPSAQPPSCPICKNEMILRTPNKGNNIGNQFWGCSRFPKCRFTMKPEVAG